MKLRAAFTLLEALIAIVVVAVVLPVALAGVSAALRGANQVKYQDLALRVAQSRVAALVADGSWQKSGTAGTCDPSVDGQDAVGMRWQMVVANWRDPTVRTLRFTVSWGTFDAGQSVSIETLVTPPNSGGT